MKLKSVNLGNGGRYNVKVGLCGDNAKITNLWVNE